MKESFGGGTHSLALSRLGSVGRSGQHEITYGPLFVETANTFEALSGTLKTAKKYNVVEYEGELLYQGASDNVVITLLKDTFDGEWFFEGEELVWICFHNSCFQPRGGHQAAP